MSDDPRPKVVGPSFWLEKGMELRGGAITARVATAKVLSTGIAWFWSAYTAFTLAGVAVTSRHFTLTQSIAFAVPSVLLIVAYGAAVWAQSHVKTPFNPNSPASVEKAHDTIAAALQKRLVLTSVLTLIAVAAVSGAITFLALPSPDEVPKLAATMASPDAKGLRVSVAGQATESVPVVVEAFGGTAQPTQQIVRSGRDGAWLALLRVGGKPASVSASWVKDGLETRYKIDLAP